MHAPSALKMPLRGVDELLDIDRTRDTLVTGTLVRRRRPFSCRGKLGNWRDRLMPNEPNRSTRGPKRERRNVRESENHEQSCQDLTSDE